MVRGTPVKNHWIKTNKNLLSIKAIKFTSNYKFNEPSFNRSAPVIRLRADPIPRIRVKFEIWKNNLPWQSFIFFICGWTGWTWPWKSRIWTGEIWIALRFFYRIWTFFVCIWTFFDRIGIFQNIFRFWFIFHSSWSQGRGNVRYNEFIVSSFYSWSLRQTRRSFCGTKKNF